MAARKMNTRWFASKTAHSPDGRGRIEEMQEKGFGGFFYTGPTRYFGHVKPPPKKH